MSAPHPASRSAFTPIFWLVPHPGTNGYVSTWGAKLAGAAPPHADA